MSGGEGGVAGGGSRYTNGWLAILCPFQQYFSHTNTKGE